MKTDDSKMATVVDRVIALLDPIELLLGLFVFLVYISIFTQISNQLNRTRLEPFGGYVARTTLPATVTTTAMTESKATTKESAFGLCFDVDGVIAHGTVVIPAAVEAFRRLSIEVDDDHDNLDIRRRRRFRVPVNFVTNSLNRPTDRVRLLSDLLDVEISTDQLIQAPSPLAMFSDLHDKHCLIVGQGMVAEIANELGFKRFCFIEDVARAYPLLDMVNHDNRRHVAAQTSYEEGTIPIIEAIILMGEPRHWESALQIVVDLLRSGGNPASFQTNDINANIQLVPDPHTVTSNQIPIVACNMDLQFKDRASSPRYGHGAFLVCLEALYKKLTGVDLHYTALVGKPSETTYRFAEHVLVQQAIKCNEARPLKTMYFIGDTPEADIAGANLYQRFIKRHRLCDNAYDNTVHHIPESRILPLREANPKSPNLELQTIEKVVSLLVCTGVYNPSKTSNCCGQVFHGHRDFQSSDYAALCKPEVVCADVREAVDYALAAEGADW